MRSPTVLLELWTCSRDKTERIYGFGEPITPLNTGIYRDGALLDCSTCRVDTRHFYWRNVQREWRTYRVKAAA